MRKAGIIQRKRALEQSIGCSGTCFLLPKAKTGRKRLYFANQRKLFYTGITRAKKGSRHRLDEKSTRDGLSGPSPLPRETRNCATGKQERVIGMPQVRSDHTHQLSVDVLNFPIKEIRSEIISAVVVSSTFAFPRAAS